MFMPLLAGAVASSLLIAPAAAAGERCVQPDHGLEPAINGGVSAEGLFPTQAMEDQFYAYMDWTKARGLSRLVAFEQDPRLLDDAIADVAEPSASGRFPSQQMEDQFIAYQRWVEDQALSPFHAFQMNDFD